MNPAWTMLDGDVVFTKQIQPPSLLAYGFRCGQKVFECSMICTDDYGSSQKMLPILLKTKHHT